MHKAYFLIITFLNKVIKFVRDHIFLEDMRDSLLHKLSFISYTLLVETNTRLENRIEENWSTDY